MAPLRAYILATPKTPTMAAASVAVPDTANLNFDSGNLSQNLGLTLDFIGL